MATGFHVYGMRAAQKGRVKRSPRDEAALRVRMLRGRHAEAILQEVIDDLGQERAGLIGKIDLHSNALADSVIRRNRAYMVPPLVEDLPAELAAMIGDMTAVVTQARYALAGGRPMPVRMSAVCHEVQRLRLGANWCGTLIGWSDRSMRPYVEVVPPDDLAVRYASDDPIAPSVVDHYRCRVIDGRDVDVVERYDLTDMDAPVFRVLSDDSDERDLTAAAMAGVEGWDGSWHAMWRYSDGRPFCRIVISGDPREPYLGLEMVEGTLRLASGYTGMWAGMRDAGFPSLHAVGLRHFAEAALSDTGDGASGGQAGPEIVREWHHTDQDRPGMLQQFGPGYDPRSVYEVLRAYGHALVDTSGLSVNPERTGGEPTATEAAALAEAIAATYGECRAHDGLVLRRLAATCNRARVLMKLKGQPVFPEAALAVMYREEIAAALAAVEPVAEEPEDGEE